MRPRRTVVPELGQAPRYLVNGGHGLKHRQVDDDHEFRKERRLQRLPHARHVELGVIPGHVVDKGRHWGEPSQRSVGSVAVVVVDERLEGRETLLVRGVWPRVGPLVEHGPVEALGLAVGLRPIRARRLVAGAEIGERLGEGSRAGVVLGVVGHHPLDADAVAGEERARLAQEGGTGRAALIGEGGGIGDPGVVVNRLVDVVIAGPRPGCAVCFSGSSLSLRGSRRLTPPCRRR